MWNRCPNCGSENTEYISDTLDGNFDCQEWGCNACGNVFEVWWEVVTRRDTLIYVRLRRWLQDKVRALWGGEEET